MRSRLAMSLSSRRCWVASPEKRRDRNSEGGGEQRGAIITLSGGVERQDEIRERLGQDTPSKAAPTAIETRSPRTRAARPSRSHAGDRNGSRYRKPGTIR